MEITPRLALEYPDGTDAVNGFPPVSAEAMNKLDTAVLVTRDTLGNRPNASTLEDTHVFHATDTGQWYLGDPAGPAWYQIALGGVAANSLGRVATNVSTSSTSYSNITGLTFPVGANEVWAFSGSMVFAAQSVPRIQLTGPASPVTVLVTTFGNGAACTYALAYNTDISAAAFPAGAPFTYSGLIVNGPNAGTVQFQYSVRPSGVGPAVVEAGSYVLATKGS